jgi:hsp70-interacting protein
MAGLDRGQSELLKWSIENSEAGRDPNAPATEPKGLSADALRALMGGPSDADLMKEAMAIIVSNDPEISLDAKMTAFDNFEQLVENLDNANNMEPLGLWTPLLSQLDSTSADLRMMAAWCAGTAVQNNLKSQERLLAMNGVPKLCKAAVNDSDKAARRKAIYALSSSVRNYQPAMNEAVKNLPKDIVGADQVSATDMDTIDAIMAKLREK